MLLQGSAVTVQKKKKRSSCLLYSALLWADLQPGWPASCANLGLWLHGAVDGGRSAALARCIAIGRPLAGRRGRPIGGPIGSRCKPGCNRRLLHLLLPLGEERQGWRGTSVTHIQEQGNGTWLAELNAAAFVNMLKRLEQLGGVCEKNSYIRGYQQE